MSKFIVETSARHVHVTQETLEILFGKGAKLTHKKDLSQPGQFACEERVTIVGPKKELPNVSILGPCRKADQVELSATDARSIGIVAPVRESGDIAGSGACKNRWSMRRSGNFTRRNCSKRHIHLTPADAEELGVKNKQVVCVKIESADRTAILCDTVCRVSENYARAMHIDTDESNAVGASRDQMGEIVTCC